MHHADLSPDAPPPAASGAWYRELNRYHWFVLVVAALGWLFDTMDQQLFVLVRQPAISELLDVPPGHDRVRDYSGYATSIFMAGWATGGLVFGWMGDRIGRARAMVLTILMYSLFTGLSAFSFTWIDFAVYRFLTGMGVGGEFAAGVSLVAEVMPQRARPYALSLLQALSTVGNVMAIGVFYVVFRLAPEQETTIVSAWRIVFLVGTLPALLALYIRRRLKEPERWQQAKRAADAHRSVAGAEGVAGGVAGAERSGAPAVTTPPPGASPNPSPSHPAAPPDELHRRLGDISEMFGDRRWRRHTIVGVLLAASAVTALWGVIFWIPELVRSFVSEADRSHYVTMAMLMLNAGAFFGIYGFSVVSGVIGRRPAFALAFLLALSSTIAVFGFMSRTEQIWWMMPLLGFSTLMIFGGLAVYFPELYPTRLRSTGVGFCYNAARYIAALGPLVLPLLARLFAAPATSERGAEGLSHLTLLSSLGGVDTPFRYAAIALSSVYLIGLVTLLAAPETKGQPLPE